MVDEYRFHINKKKSNYKLLEGKLTHSAWAVNSKSSFLLSTDGNLGLLYSDWSRKPATFSNNQNQILNQSHFKLFSGFCHPFFRS